MQKAVAIVVSYILVFLLGVAVCGGVGYALLVKPNNATCRELENELASSRTEVARLGELTVRSDDIARRETEIARREGAIARRETENNRRTGEIYTELDDIISGSYGDIEAIERLALLVEKLEQMANH